MIRSKVLVKSGQMIISPCGVIGSSKEYKFSYKFDDAQWKKIFQILKEFFCISEDVSSVWQYFFEKEKEKEGTKSHAWANESELIKKSKINLVWHSPLIQIGKRREINKGLLNKVLI